MAPTLSLIVPNRNHAARLPRLLDSVAAQQGVGLEVLIMDDCSDAPYPELIEAYRNRGLDIRLLEHKERLYTKNARLAGIRAARGRIIAFADADDALPGTEILAEHVRRMDAEGADILHFRSVITGSRGEFQRYFYVADPFAEQLRGREIFERFLAADVHGSSAIWNKLFLREKFLPLCEYAEKSAVRRYVEDLYLNSLYLLHAERYAGSHLVGYAYSYVEKDRADTPERAVYTYAMRAEMLPYMRTLGCAPELVDAYARYLEHYLSLCTGRLAIAIGKEEGADITDATVNSLLTHTDAATLIKVLLLGGRINAEKVVGATRLLRTGRVY